MTAYENNGIEVANEMNAEKDTETEKLGQTCPAVGYQAAKVCVPVTVQPFAHVGEITTKCLGKPEVAGGENCTGVKNGICTFVIRQTVCVAVPVLFGAKSVVGEPHVHCLGAAENPSCGKTEGTAEAETDAAENEGKKESE